MKNMNVMKLTKLMVLLLSSSVVADVRAMRSSPSSVVVLDLGAQLRSAAVRGAIVELQRLIRAGAAVYVNRKDTCGFAPGYTPLHWAVQGTIHGGVHEGHAACVPVLIAAGAVADSKNNWGKTPLHAASEQGHDACVRALITAGATVDSKNDAYCTPLHKASENGRAACVQALLDAKAGVDTGDGSDRTSLYWASSNGVFFESRDEDRDWVRFNESKNCIKLLLYAGARCYIDHRGSSLEMQALVDRCAQELPQDIINRRIAIVVIMRTVSALEHFPPGLPELIASFSAFEIVPTPTRPKSKCVIL